MSEISVTWATRGDSLDEQIAALLPTFATQLRFVNELNNDWLFHLAVSHTLLNWHFHSDIWSMSSLWLQSYNTTILHLFTCYSTVLFAVSTTWCIHMHNMDCALIQAKNPFSRPHNCNWQTVIGEKWCDIIPSQHLVSLFALVASFIHSHKSCSCIFIYSMITNRKESNWCFIWHYHQ